jgi:hypothetical protein
VFHRLLVLRWLSRQRFDLLVDRSQRHLRSHATLTLGQLRQRRSDLQVSKNPELRRTKASKPPLLLDIDMREVDFDA